VSQSVSRAIDEESISKSRNNIDNQDRSSREKVPDSKSSDGVHDAGNSENDNDDDVDDDDDGSRICEVMLLAQINNAHSFMHTAVIIPEIEEEQFGPDS
jgi:hypothetical protein